MCVGALMQHSASLLCCFLSCACLLVSVPTLSGQNAADAWPAVTKEDLALDENPADRGAAAMILERQVYTDDEKRVQTEFVRIKIFTETGRSNADIEIPYVVKSSSVENIRGRTLQADGSVVPFSGVIFDKVVARYKKFAYDAKAFTLPAVRVGSIIEYSYELHWKERLPDYVRNPFNYAVVEGFTIPTATWTIQQNLFTRHAVFLFRPVKKGLLDFAKVRLPDNDPRSQPDGSLEGTLEIVFTGQEALDRRLSGYDEDDAGRRKLMEDEVKELAPAGAIIEIDEVSGWQDSEQPLRVKCHLHAGRFAARTSKRMLFPLSVFQTNSKHPFPQIYRTQPVYFGHGYRTSDAIEVSLPIGYKLEALPPESTDVTQFAEFHAKRTSESGIVRLDRHTEMKGYYFPLKYYLPLRAYFQKLRQSDAQNVILIREDAERAQ
jgi:hypothetical protein